MKIISANKAELNQTHKHQTSNENITQPEEVIEMGVYINQQNNNILKFV